MTICILDHQDASRTQLDESDDALLPTGALTLLAAKWLLTFKPVEVYHYHDRVRIYLKIPLNAQWLHSLKMKCGRVISVVEPAFFDASYRQKLEICQPQKGALNMLALLPDHAIVCYVEVACDLICLDEFCLRMVAEGFLAGFLQPHHRGKEPIVYTRLNELTGYSTRKNPEKGSRRNGFWFQWYIDRPCKITGEPHCFHFEGKHEGRQTVKRIGISHPRDLILFEFNAYFQKHVGKIHLVDFERLGRSNSNQLSGGKRKKPRIDETGYHRDVRRGQMIYRNQSILSDGKHRALQIVVDRRGRGPWLTPHTTMFMNTNGHTS